MIKCSALRLMLLCLLALLHGTSASTTSPIFVTSVSGIFESGSAVLSLSSLTPSGSFSSQTTTITYSNSYFTAPVFAHGIKYIYANWITTTQLVETIFDISSTSSTLTSQTLRANFTTSTVQQFSVNYIVCLPNTFFFLDVRSVYLDLTGFSTISTAAMNSSRSQNITATYKDKGNFSNAQVILSTVGLSMMRQANSFEYTFSVAEYSNPSCTLTLTLNANNGMRFIRYNLINYESVSSTYTGYIDMGFVNLLGGTFPDSSGLALSVTGAIFTGMADWAMSDMNTIYTYNMSLSQRTYSLTSSSVTRSKTSYLWYRGISCPSYYYLVGNLCYSCHYTCTTCSDSTNTSCLTCQTSSFRTYDVNTLACPCNNNYYDSGARICQQIVCPSYCTACSSDNVCTGCVSSYYRSLSNGSCLCASYSIDMSAQGLMSCTFCYPTCLTCSTLASSTACLTCSLSRDRRQFVASNNTCVCTSGYYEIPNLVGLYASYIYIGAPCLRCLYHCQTCTGNTSCLSCNSTLRRTLDGSTNFCLCSGGYYDDGINQACGTCSYTCATCNSTGCLTCPSSRSLTGRTCPCLTGYYDSGGATCSACSYSCYTCTNSSGCQTCNSTYFRSMTANLSCVCISGYYDAGVQTCVACDSSCASCNGASSNSCLTCSSLKYRQVTSNNTCVCQSGYYDVSPLSSTCAGCYYKCATCSGSNTICTSCSATNFRSQSGSTCACSTGYFDDGGNQLCQKCLYFCLTCTNLFVCTSCDSNTRDTSNLTTCTCLTGFYQNNASSCQPCKSTCLTCTNANNCASCPSSRYISDAQACLCNPRTFEPSCGPCHYSCLSCSLTYDNCITCNGTAMRLISAGNSTSSCICYSGYYDGGNQLCAACNPSCASCTNASACVSCQPNRQLNGSFCSCLSQFYQNNVSYNCLACHYSCLSCSQYSVCTNCSSANFRTTSGTTTLCACMAGYYDNGNSAVCYVCLSTCATCSSFSVCTSCNSTLHLYPSNTDCLCTAGYFLNATSLLCVACDYSCATCTDSISCATCQANRTAVVGGLCVCTSGMFDSSSTKSCQSCAYPCVTCVDNSTKCLSCDTNHRTYSSSTNQCVCKGITYDTGLSCASCLSTCQTCTNGTACLTCLTGSLRDLDSSNQCVCPSGYHDQNGVNLVCQMCNYTCTSCTASTSCTSCYSGRIAVNNSFCICPSTLYYDNGVTPQCLSCRYSCLSCLTTSSYCTACLSSNFRTLSNNTCLCNTRYYDDGSTAVCQSCHYSCLSCGSNASCLTCNSSSYRTFVSGPYCSCMSGYFDVTNTQLCSSCSYTCLTCISGSLFCTTCPSTRTLDNVSSSCACNGGLYDGGAATCLACSYQCATCSNGNNCLTCPSTRMLNASMKCQCNNSYYDVANQNACSLCAATCLTCSNYQTCTQCDTANNHRQLVNNSCICDSGYYDASSLSPANYTCQLCPYSCATCISGMRCTSCNSNYQRNYSLSTFLCNCVDGYYDDPSNSPCIACPFDCLTCSNGTTCLTCPTTRSLTNTSRCLCTSNFFANGTLCEKCPEQCATCSNSSSCLTCNGVRVPSSGACICPVGLYSIAGTANCSNCDYSCASCVSSSQCSTCNSTLKRYLTSTFCFCMQYYYDDRSRQQCQNCSYSCLTCSQAGACLTCDGTKNRIFDSTTSLCSCVSGYFEDSSQLCIKCGYSCLTCVNSSTSCTSCVPTSNRVLSNNSCQCPSYYYYDTLSSAVCASCDYTCYSCSGSPTTCTSCLNSTFRVLSGSSCPCSNGFFSVVNNPVCSICSYQCVTCQGDAANCTLCSSANFRNTTPLCGCINGYYDNGTAACLTCNYTCQTCLNIFSCSTCNLNTNHRKQNNITLFCDCIEQYYDNGGAICQQCHYTCLTCIHPSNCQTCPTTRSLSLSSCLCNAKYYDDGSLLCASCNYTCQTCSNLSSCSSCNIGNFRVFDANTNLCSCKTGYYDTGIELCSACDASCLTCAAASACLTCPSYINKTINATASNFCICLYGYYQNATAGAAMGYNSVCSPCHYSCQTCSSTSTYCTLCNATANRYLTASNLCACLVGYFEILGQQNCLNCYSNCLSCFGTLANNCLSCDNTTYFLNNSCYQICPSYYTSQTSPSRKCVSCPANCLSCPVSTTTCGLCASPYFIFAYNSSHSNCVNSCPQYYYQLSKTCLPCVWPCVTCSSSTSCLTCSAGYYLANNYCFRCQNSCLTCSGSTALDCLTCVVDYILKNGVCQKMQCAATQYVDSILGCLNCSSNFANSLTCKSTGPLTCQPGYMLSNNTCGNCTVVKGYVYDATTGRCKDFCGDGIVISDLCDDGNNLNGDGCSSVCTIESGWRCPSNLCKLEKIPNLTLIDMKAYPANNTVVLKMQLNIGLRLIPGNFILKFTTITKFGYSVNPLNPQYSIYQLVIVYYQSPQNEQLSISIKSPISRLLTHTSSRQLQSATTALSLNISLSLNLDVPIQTYPPAIYISSQASQIYSQYLLGLVAALHIAIVVAIAVALIKRLKVMLFVIDSLNSITILYILAGLGLYNITLISGQSFQGLQPFLYPFGQTLKDETTNFYHFNYRSNFFSSTALQALAIFVSLVGLVYKAFSQEQNSQNYWHYYRTSFVFAFSYDLLLSSFCTFFWSPYSSYQSSYSWMASIFTLIWIVCEGAYYYRSLAELKLDRKIVPDFTYITGVNQEKGKNEISNIMLEFEQSKQKSFKQKEKERQKIHQLSRDRDDPNTQEGQQPFPDTAYQQTKIKYYDLTPSNESANTVLHSNHITHRQLPILSIFFAIIFSLVVNVQSPKIRSGLLLGAALGYLLAVLITRNETFKAIRTIKVIIFAVLYVMIAALGLAGATMSSINLIVLDIILVVLVCVALSVNLVCFIVNVLKSEAYRQYVKQKQVDEANERKKRQTQYRQKIYNNKNEQANKTNSKLTIEEPKSSFNIFQHQVQLSEEQVEEKQLKISALKNFRDHGKAANNREKNNSTMLNQIDDQFSGIQENILPRKDLIDQKNIAEIKDSRISSARGNRVKAIRDSQLSKNRRESPSSYFDNTLERIDEEKGVRKKAGRSNDKEEVSPSAMKKKVKKRVIKGSNFEQRRIDDQISLNNDEKPPSGLEDSKKIEDILEEMDMPKGFKRELKIQNDEFRPRLSMDEISSIKQERREEFMEQGIEDEKGGLSVFNKILQDYKVYRNKKVNKKKLPKK